MCHIGHLNENLYQDAHVIKVYNNMGLKMCGRRCLHHKLCSAINYNPVQLYCELLHETDKDRKISSVPDFKYSTIDKWSSVFQNRYDGSIEFQVNRTWSDYRNGFGLYSSEYWLGLEYIYLLTRFDLYMLRVDLETNYGVSLYATYSTFKLNNEADLYRMTINGYKGTAGDLEGKTGMMFTNGHTFRSPGDDKSPVKYEDDIFYRYGYYQTGAWWSSLYTRVNLNGHYMPGVKDSTSMIWYGYQNNTSFTELTSSKTIVLPDSEIVLHHYRKCRTDYWFNRWSFSAKERKVVYDNTSKDDLCFGFRKYYQKDMEIIMERIRDNVLKIRTKLNVTM
ncbi:unnamed protein product [Mytilus edulis]|uniref:Fibrinogen C-terminal domain-containing protein n=1 Tax=Mytilus edulis TaxID=6550 RepID=A0A8S3R0V0_MYTED|nr:unnamed protein product [Mytilus edulis]